MATKADSDGIVGHVPQRFALTPAVSGIDLCRLAVPSYLFLRSGSTEPAPRLHPSLAETSVKSRTKQSLIKRVNSQSSITTCKASDSGPFYQILHRTIWQHLSIVLFLLLSIGAGLSTATAQAQIRAYVTNVSSDTVSVIDTPTNTVVATVPVGLFPFGVAITPDGTRAYVTNYNSNTVSVIDTATNTVVATILVGTFPFGVAITPDGTRAYVTYDRSNTVSVIDTATNTVVATVPVGPSEGGRMEPERT
jgi:YVTN family beta-propeller protein